MPDATVVTTAGSLADMREYLVRNRGASPWTHVVLVTHGSPWTGLRAPVYNGGDKAGFAAIRAAADGGEFPPLPPGTLAPAARFTLESCGMGRRPDFLAALARLLAGTDAAPVVEAAQGYVAFKLAPDGTASRRELAAEFVVLPARDAVLPAALVDARANALGAPLGAFDFETHPVRVRVDYPDTPMPAPSQAARIARGDPQVRDQLDAIGVRLADLQWRVEREGRGYRLWGEGVVLVVHQSARTAAR
jgi:hypothetical protein